MHFCALVCIATEVLTSPQGGNRVSEMCMCIHVYSTTPLIRMSQRTVVTLPELCLTIEAVSSMAHITYFLAAALHSQLP